MRHPSRTRRSALALAATTLATLAGALGLTSAASAQAGAASSTYRNPLTITIPGTPGSPGTPDRVETFADPAVIRGQDGVWYAYATSDPLNDRDRDAAGALTLRRIPMARSTDLVNWTYVGEAFTAGPEWAEPTTGIWAPEVRYFNGRYHLYYTATNTDDAISGDPGCTFDSAVGVATSASPTGPWTHSDAPVVAPRRNPERAGDPCQFFWSFDPMVVAGTEPGERILYYGSYYGGVEARRLSADGLTSVAASATRITAPDRYEGSSVVRRGEYYYFFGSATDCCRGPLTGYSVFTGRSTSPLGPFVDRDGVPLTATRVGGTPVISMNGNRWVGTGHNAIIQDLAGQDWFVYHALDQGDAYLANPNPGAITKRPMLMDRLDWRDGWPSVRAGHWASDAPQAGPVTAQGGEPSPLPARRRDDRPGAELEQLSDEFEGGEAERGWRWVREPVGSLTERPGSLRFPTQAGDLSELTNSAPLFTRRAPRGDFMVETKFDFDLPAEGVFNFQQAGVALWQHDDAFLKLAHVSIFGTRQTEWAKEVPTPVTPRNQRYGNTVIGAPGLPEVATTTTWLRIVRRMDSRTGAQLYTGYSSLDGERWVRGGTWTHDLREPRIALFAMGGVGHTADFDYVRVYRLAGGDATASAARARASRREAAPRGVRLSPASRQAYSRRFSSRR